MTSLCIGSVLRPGMMASRSPLRSAHNRTPAFCQRRAARIAVVAPLCHAKTPLSSQEKAATVQVPSFVQNVAKTALVSALALAVAFCSPSAAEAARSGGRAGGSSFSSRSSMSRSYSAPSMGRSSAMYSAPAVSYTPSIFVPVSPFGFGMGYYSGGSTLFTVMVLAVLAFAAINTLSSMSGADTDDYVGAEEVTVMRVQVGLLGMARTLKANLDTIASRADTSDPEGLNYLLQEAALALLRNPDYYVYGATNNKLLNSADEAERAYNKASMEERSKFREETFSNVGGVTRRRQMAGGDEKGVNELMVVTMVIAAEGRWKLPEVRSTADLRSALNYVASIGASKLIGVELLWTPQAEGDFYTRDEVIQDYPNLVPL